MLTKFTNHAARRKRQFRVSLRDLAPRVMARTADKKAALPWLKLARFGDQASDKGSLRHDANVLGFDGVEADYDGERVDVAEACDLLRSADLAALVYTSPRHTDAKPRWRVLCPVSKSLPPADRSALIARLNGVLGGVLAGESFALSQSYYYGSVASNPAHAVELIEGRYLDLAEELDEHAIGKAGTPAAANNMLRMFRMLMRFAVERGWRKDDPSLHVRKIGGRSDGFHSWTEDEIAAFAKKWPLGSRARLALELLLNTAQRRSDVVTMGRQHVRDGSIHVCQQKTGTRLAIPIHPELRKALDATPSDNLTFLVTAYGKPFSPAGFTNWFRDCVRAAGLTDQCSPHGLRKAASRRLAEAGCSAHQIMAVTGHKSLKEVVIYTAAANQEHLARAALATIGGDVKRTKSVKPSRKV